MKGNNTSIIPAYYHHSTNVRPLDQLHILILVLICAGCLFGNLLVIFAIHRTRKSRVPSFMLIMHLSISDLLTAISGIPFSIIVYNIVYRHSYFPYGEAGCRTLWPFTTHAKNCSSFTLVVIAIERILNTSSLRIKLNRLRTIVTIVIINILSVAIVIPYGIHLKYTVHQNGTAYCYEEWSSPWSTKFYTALMFAVQYAIPLLLMIICYSLTWRKIYVRNNFVIKMSEDYEKKMEWQQTSYSGRTSVTSISTTVTSMDQTNTNTEDVFEMTSSTFEHASLFSVKRSRSGPAITQTKSDVDIEETESEVLETKTKKNIRTISRRKSESAMTRISRRKSSQRRRSDNESYKDRRVEELSYAGSCPGSAQSLLSPPLLRDQNRGGNGGTSPYNLSTTSISSSASTREIRRFDKSPYVSQIAYMRHRQSIRTLQMFTTIVVIFFLTALPNHIIWFFYDYAELHAVVADVFIILTYVSSVVNPWIYGGFQSVIRKAYIDMICCVNRQKKSYEVEGSAGGRRSRTSRQTSTVSTTLPSIASPSLYPKQKEQLFRERKTSFDQMFQEHSRNFDKMRHLYCVSRVIEEPDTDNEESDITETDL